MGRKKPEEQKKETKERLPTLQISCKEEFKNDVEQLAMAFGYSDTKTMLFELVEQFLNLPSNQAQLKKYRAMLRKKPAMPFSATADKVTSAVVDEGGGSDETT